MAWSSWYFEPLIIGDLKSGPSLFHIFMSSVLTRFPITSVLRSYSSAESCRHSPRLSDQQLASPPLRRETPSSLYWTAMDCPSRYLFSQYYLQYFTPHPAALSPSSPHEYGTFSNNSSLNHLSSLKNIRMIFLIGEYSISNYSSLPASPTLSQTQQNGGESEVEKMVQFLRFHGIYSDYYVLDKV